MFCTIGSNLLPAASESFFNPEISPQDNSTTQDILGTAIVFKVEPSGNSPIYSEPSPSPKVKVDTKDSDIGHDPSLSDDLNSEQLGNSSPTTSHPLDKSPIPTGESSAAPTARTDSKSLPHKPAKVQMRGGQRRGVKRSRSSSPTFEIILTPQKQSKSGYYEQQPKKLKEEEECLAEAHDPSGLLQPIITTSAAPQTSYEQDTSFQREGIYFYIQSSYDLAPF